MLDEDALAQLVGEDVEAAVALLADLSVAIDASLRESARKLAARVIIDLAAARGSTPRVRRLVRGRHDGDVDLEGTLDRTGGLRPRSAEDVVTRAWGADQTPVVLLVDRSGSMSGGAVARAAVAAAAIAVKGAGACGVTAFGRDRIVLAAPGQSAHPSRLVDSLLQLRGHGTTNIAAALREAATQLAAAPRQSRRTVVLLSDCHHTEGPDPIAALSGIDILHVVLPDDQDEQLAAARRLSGATGGQVRVARDLAEVARVIPALLR